MRKIYIALSLLLVSILLVNRLEAAEETKEYDYYSSVYTHLEDTDSVYESTTYEELITILESEGTHVFLFGGAWCGNTQAVVSFINDVAKEYKIDTIYNFDTKLDGKNLHIRDTNNAYANLYVDLVNKYLTNIVTLYDKNDGNPSHQISYVDSNNVSQIANKLQVPFLFTYNKDNKADGQSAPIISYYEEMLLWKDFTDNGLDTGKLDNTKVETYKAKVRTTFDKISTNKVANVAKFTAKDYIKTVYNAASKTEIIGSEEILYDTITYHELINLLESKGTYAILFGGAWCGNTQAVIKYINEYAIKHKVKKVYLFDTKLDGKNLHIRDTNNAYANLYVDLVNTYLTNIETLYEKNDGNPSHEISYVDSKGVTQVANKLQVPYFFTYNKDNEVSGKKAPIIDHVELMYTWENIQPDYIDSDGVKGENFKTYIDKLNVIFTEYYNLTKKDKSTEDVKKEKSKKSVAPYISGGILVVLIGGVIAYIQITKNKKDKKEDDNLC